MSSQKKGGGFADLFAEMEKGGQKVAPRRSIGIGQEVTGPVVAITADAVFVDLGQGLEGMLDRAEVVEEDGTLGVRVGDEVRAHVVKKGDGPFYLRKRLGKNDEAQEAIRQAFEHKIPIEGKVTAVNRGGLDVEVAGSR
ncbi:MAG: S1 RNA-binding domain-containing protein, partial [Myxococcota bacterium]